MPTKTPTTPTIVLNRVVLEGYRGLEFLEVDLAQHPSGVIFSGTKGVGKTSALRAIETLLKGTGKIGPESINLDANKLRIRLDFTQGGDLLSEIRSVTQRSNRAELNRADGTPMPGGAVEQLKAIFGFGENDIDPMKLWAEQPQEMRRTILAAMPTKLTPEDLTRWCEVTPEGGWHTEGNGHEVLAAVREMKVKERSRAKELAGELEVKLLAAQAAARALKPQETVDLTPDAAFTHVAAAQGELAKLTERQRAVAQRQQDSAKTVARVAELRQKAEAKLVDPAAIGPSADQISAAEDAEQGLAADVKRLRDELERAVKAQTEAIEKVRKLKTAAESADRLMGEANTLVQQADELEKTIAAGQDDQLPQQIAEAEKALADANRLVESARATAAWTQKAEEAAALHTQHRTAEDAVAKLDRVVKRLTSDAVAELASRGNAIPGLTITADDILYEADGKKARSIKLLSDGEKLEFCIQVKKRIHTGLKVMLVDGIEKLPPSLQPGFVASCLEGGWILFGTRVADGGLQIIDCYQLSQETLDPKRRVKVEHDGREIV